MPFDRNPTPSQPALLLFLSHAGIDTEAARALKARIETAPDALAIGLRVWFDKDDLRAGEPWQPQLEEAIQKHSTAFAVYLGSRGIVNWVEAEVRLALSRATGDSCYNFIPIIAAGSGGAVALPGFAAQYQAVRDVEHNPLEFEKLLRAILRQGYSSELRSEGEPFFGLRAIDESRSHLFFGREQDTEDLVKLLRTESLVMVTGDSGSGKSSLVKAGLVPAWRGGAIALLNEERAEDTIWHVVQMKPRSRPLSSLGEAVGEAARQLGLSLSDRTILEDRASSGDVDKVRGALRCDLPPHATRTLLIIDQLEELVTVTPPGQRGPFVELMLALAQSADNQVRLALTMRRDYYNLLSQFPSLYDRLEAKGRRARYLLTRMKDEGLRRVVTEPLRLAGTPEGDRNALAQTVLRDVGERPGDLALVQMALTETWEQRERYGGDLLRTYAEIGGVEGAIARAAEDVYTQVLDAAERQLAEPMFLRLVRLGDTGGATRRIAKRAEFDAKAWSLIQKLAGPEGKRLLLVGGGEGSDSVEISHEALVTQWPRYQNWLQAAARDKRVLDRLIERAGGFPDTSECPPKEIPAEWLDRLATGADLAEFRELSQRHCDWLSKAERAFTTASECEWQTQVDRDRRTNRNIRNSLVAVSVLSIAMIVALALVYVQNSRFRDERDRANLQSAILLADKSILALKSGDFRQAFSDLNEALTNPIMGSSPRPPTALEKAALQIWQSAIPVRLPGRINRNYEISYPLSSIFAIDDVDAKKLHVWSLDGTLRGTVVQGTRIDGLTVAPDRGTIFTLSRERRRVMEWRVEDAKLVQSYQLAAAIANTAISFEYLAHKDGILLSGDPDFLLLDLATGSTLNADSTSIPSQFRKQYQADLAALAKLHERDSGSDITGRTVINLGWRNTAVSKSKCSFALTGGNDGSIRQWDLATGELAGTIPFSRRVYNLDLSPTCDTLSASDEYGYTEIIDLATRQPLASFRAEAPENVLGFDLSGRAFALLGHTETSVYPLSPSITPANYALDGVVSAHLRKSFLLYHRQVDETHFVGAYDTVTQRTVYESRVSADQINSITPLLYIPAADGIVALIDTGLVFLGHARERATDGSEPGTLLLQLNERYKDPLSTAPPLVLDDISIFAHGRQSWGLVTLDVTPGSGSARVTAKWTPANLDSYEIPPDRKVSAKVFRSAPDALLIDTSSEIIVYNLASGQHRAVLNASESCGYYSFRSASGALFVQIYPLEDGQACLPRILRIDAPEVGPVEVASGFAVDTTRWDEYALYENNDQLNVKRNDRETGCAISLREGWSVGYFIPGDRPIDSNSTQWLTGVEGFFSGALHKYGRRARVLHSSRSRTATIVYARELETFSLDDCRSLSVSEVHVAHPEGEVHDVELFSTGELLLVTTGPDNAGILIRTRSGAEIMRIPLRREVWHVIAGATLFVVEGYRPPHRVVELDRFSLAGIDLPFNAVFEKLSAAVDLECARANGCAGELDAADDVAQSDDSVVAIRPSSLEAGNVASCVDPLRHPLERYPGEEAYLDEIVVSPFIVGAFDHDECFGEENSFFWDGPGHREFARARYLWSVGRRDEALVDLRDASALGNELASHVLNYYPRAAQYAVDDAEFDDFEGQSSSEWRDRIAMFHFSGLEYYGGLPEKLRRGIDLGDPYSLAIAAEALVSQRGPDPRAVAYAGRALKSCIESATSLALVRPRKYCERIRANLARWSFDEDDASLLSIDEEALKSEMEKVTVRLPGEYVRTVMARMGGY